MSKRYTPKVKRDVDSIPVPHDFVVDIVEYDLDRKNPYYGIRFYESHWRYFNDKERAKCAAYLIKVKRAMEAHGLNVTLDPIYDVPGGQEL